MSDIKFADGDVILVEARAVDIKAPDLLLDFKPNRKGGTPFRRALVHDSNDGLTLNFNRDYPGGITMYGDARVLRGSLITDGNILTRGDVILRRPSGDVFFNRLVDTLVTRIEQLEAKVDALGG